MTQVTDQPQDNGTADGTLDREAVNYDPSTPTKTELRTRIASMFTDEGEHFEKKLDAILTLLEDTVREVIGEDEEVTSMEEYVEYRGGALNIDDDDNPEIAGEARNELRAEQRQRLVELKEQGASSLKAKPSQDSEVQEGSR